MPATFAHPAFAWPLRRWGLPWMALVVGSMVPDLAHLLPRRWWTDHTAASVVLFSLPVGLLVFIVWERGIAPALAHAAPGPWREALVARVARPRATEGVVLALILGALTHVGIDALTHARAAPVERFAVLRAVWCELPLLGPVRTYAVLQYGGGLLGTGFLAHRAVAWARAHQVRPLRLCDLVPSAAFIGAVGVGAAISAHRESWWLEQPERLKVFLVAGAASGMVLSAGLAAAYALAWWTARALRPARRPPSADPRQPSVER